MIKKYVLIISVFFLFGCSIGPQVQTIDTSINLADRDVWVPADAEDLEQRRIRQAQFDGIEKEIEDLFLRLETTGSKEAAIRGETKDFIPQIGTLEATMVGMIADERNRKDNLGKELKDVRLGNKNIDSQVEKLNRVIKPDPVFSIKKYISAFNYFRKGRYIKSAHLFEKSLASNPPYSLTDNILFGLGMSHYKLGSISRVSEPLSRLIVEYPDSEKWYISHVMIALAHQKKREKSQALHVLEQGLKKEPPYFIRSMILNLIDLIQEEFVDAAS